MAASSFIRFQPYFHFRFDHKWFLAAGSTFWCLVDRSRRVAEVIWRYRIWHRLIRVSSTRYRIRFLASTRIRYRYWSRIRFRHRRRSQLTVSDSVSVWLRSWCFLGILILCYICTAYGGHMAKWKGPIMAPFLIVSAWNLAWR